MSVGGINVQQPLVGVPPTGDGSAPPIGSGQLAPVTVAGPVLAPAAVNTSAMATNTAFVPATEQQTGTAVDGGGLVQAGAAQATALGGARGPAAWNDDWAKKFKDAGAPQQVIQQLTFTGAMGADEAQLQQMLADLKGQIDTELAKFEHDHPEEFKKLRSKVNVATALGMQGESDRAAIAQFAAGVNSGQIPESTLKQTVEQAGMSMSSEMKKMALSIALFGLLPGWGFLRLSGFLFNDGKEPFIDYPMWDNGMNKAITIMTAIGGGMAIFNNVRGAMHVAAGHAAIRAGGDAATMAAHSGLDNLTLGRKIWSYVPGTQLNRQVGMLGGLDDVKVGIAEMTGVRRESAQNYYNKALSGDAPLWRDSASKWSMLGLQPNSRGFILGHIFGKKGGMSIQAEGARQVGMVDGRTTGKTVAAYLASWGVEFADDVASNGVGANLRTRIFQEFSEQAANPVLLRERMLGEAGRELLKAGLINRPTRLIERVLAKTRPGGLQDVLWAVDNLDANKIGRVNGWHGTAWHRIPMPGRVGILGSAGAAGLYFGMFKPQMDSAKKAAEEAAKQQAGAGGMTAEDQALLQQFAALPKDQQAQIIQQQHAQIQQALQTPNMTPDQQQQLAAAQAELQLLMQVANGQMPTADAAAAGVGAPAAAGGTPQFTAQGLGLAN